MSTSIRRMVGALTFVAGVVTHGQVGKGLLDANQVPEAELAKLPGMTADIAKAAVAARPFASIVDFNKFLVDRNGKVSDRFDSGDKPEGEKVTQAIEKALK